MAKRTSTSKPATTTGAATARGKTPRRPRRRASVTVAPPTQEQIEKAAYYRYLERGATDGTALDDWVHAERQLQPAQAASPAHR